MLKNNHLSKNYNSLSCAKLYENYWLKGLIAVQMQ